MRLAERMTEKQLKAVTKTRACGGVPGLVVKVVKLKDGSLAKYFILRESTINRIFTLGRYPQMSLADAFKKAADWKVKIRQGIDPSEEEKALKASLRRKSAPSDDRLTFEQLIYQWIEFNEARGRWNNPSKPKKEVWKGFFRNHIPDSIRMCPVEELKPEMFAAALGEKWRTMIDTPERILSDARQAIDWAIRSEFVPPMLNPAQVKDGKLGDLLPLVRAEGGHEPAQIGLAGAGVDILDCGRQCRMKSHHLPSPSLTHWLWSFRYAAIFTAVGSSAKMYMRFKKSM